MSYEKRGIVHDYNEGRGTQLRNEIVPPELGHIAENNLATLWADLQEQHEQGSTDPHYRTLEHTDDSHLDDPPDHHISALPKGMDTSISTTTTYKEAPHVVDVPQGVNRDFHDYGVDHTYFNLLENKKGTHGRVKRPPIPGTPYEHHEVISHHKQTHHLDRTLGGYHHAISSNDHVILPDIHPVDSDDVARNIQHVFNHSVHDMFADKFHQESHQKRRRRKDEIRADEEVEDEKKWDMIINVLFVGGIIAVFFGAVYGLGTVSRIITARTVAAGLNP